MKKYLLKESQITVIGEMSPNLPTTSEDSHYLRLRPGGVDWVVGSYKGIEVKPYYSSLCKSKKEAIEKLASYTETTFAFPDGTQPFGVVFYVRGLGWIGMTSNTVANTRIISENMVKAIA